MGIQGLLATQQRDMIQRFRYGFAFTGKTQLGFSLQTGSSPHGYACLLYTSVQPFVDSAANVRVRDVEVLSVYIDMQPIPFNRGYYSIDMTFFFDVALDLFGGAMVGCEHVNGISIFNKKVILFGSEGNVKMFSSDCSRDEDALNGNSCLLYTSIRINRRKAGRSKNISGVTIENYSGAFLDFCTGFFQSKLNIPVQCQYYTTVSDFIGVFYLK